MKRRDGEREVGGQIVRQRERGRGRERAGEKESKGEIGSHVYISWRASAWEGRFLQRGSYREVLTERFLQRGPQQREPQWLGKLLPFKILISN